MLEKMHTWDKKNTILYFHLGAVFFTGKQHKFYVQYHFGINYQLCYLRKHVILKCDVHFCFHQIPSKILYLSTSAYRSKPPFFHACYLFSSFEINYQSLELSYAVCVCVCVCVCACMPCGDCYPIPLTLISLTCARWFDTGHCSDGSHYCIWPLNPATVCEEDTECSLLLMSFCLFALKWLKRMLFNRRNLNFSLTDIVANFIQNVQCKKSKNVLFSHSFSLNKPYTIHLFIQIVF